MRAHESFATTVIGPLLALVALAGLVPVNPAAQAEFPFTRERGRAAVEYRSSEIHVVAAYYYSQQNHDTRWLLIQAAVSSTDLMTLHRNAFVLRTPNGREIPLASQSRFGQDIERVRLLLQNAATTRHDVTAYFNQRDRIDGMQFYTLPFGAVVHDEVVVDNHRVAVGDLFFEAPTGSWEDGTYSLVVRYEDGQAELPIELD